tara:strand:+ start:71 stop:223 length:153 start_codon:yes stop_codon:yes gene_type:complete
MEQVRINAKGMANLAETRNPTNKIPENKIGAKAIKAKKLFSISYLLFFEF